MRGSVRSGGIPREVWYLAVECVEASVEQFMHVWPPEPGLKPPTRRR